MVPTEEAGPVDRKPAEAPADSSEPPVWVGPDSIAPADRSNSPISITDWRRYAATVNGPFVVSSPGSPCPGGKCANQNAHPSAVRSATPTSGAGLNASLQS